jgi:hypothetical protein
MSYKLFFADFGLKPRAATPLSEIFTNITLQLIAAKIRGLSVCWPDHRTKKRRANRYDSGSGTSFPELKAADNGVAAPGEKVSAKLKLLRRVILVATALSLATVAATPDSSAGSKYFDEARRNLNSGADDDAAASAEKGWAAVLAAGPIASGFLPGAYDASGIFASLGRALRAEAVYTEAETLCAGPGLQLVRLRLQYMHADNLIRNSQYVKAEGILRVWVIKMPLAKRIKRLPPG